ncbi:MAG TPA: L-seryl-tRNA(Sec) selenium transferase [Thermoanaerobaculia bacterium]|nr:L-seryl-tRNA(Sec) selenium transferase [Thermoanaerobaculia bacterium]
MTRTTDARRRLPAMDLLLARPAFERLVRVYGRSLVRVQAASALAALRGEIAGGRCGSGDAVEAAIDDLPRRVEAELERQLGAPLQRVLNATGILIHTNLGRVPLPREVSAALPPLLDAYCDLELDLGSGRRGDRNAAAEGLLCALTGAPAALVVNNNAGALVLALAALAQGREAMVSRGELVEIGGSFRIPGILEAAGVELCEVGTTNRTRLADYESAIGPRTALLLKIFPSNYRIAGFVESVAPDALVDLGRRREVAVLVDEGSGLLRPHPAPELRQHQSLADLVTLGCDLACGSGDKLLGGPQAGILVGKESAIRACARHPLYRALRPDRGGLAALSLVLRRHLAGLPMPLERMWPDPVAHGRRVRAVAAALGGEVAVVEGYLGGGSAPEAGIPAEAVVVPEDDLLLHRLRGGQPPVVAYQKEGRLVLDLRTIDPEDDAALVAAVRAAASSQA